MTAYGPDDRETTLPLPAVAEYGSEPEYGEAEYPRPELGNRRSRRRFGRFLYRATLTIVSLAACLLLGFGVLLAVTPSAGQAPQILARLARERHIGYPGPAAPANFSRPLVATEDHRFYSGTEVGGIDPLALARGAKSVITGGPAQGGATIAIQLAKLLYVGADSPRHDTFEGDLTEVALAVKLEAMYGKQQILQMYAEAAYYGHGYYGLEQASCGYFGHPAAALTVTQGAMLAGVVNAPDDDDPVVHPAQARTRLEHVITRMVAVGYLTPRQGSAALSAPLGLTPGHDPAC
jgi:membrane peptidoglycan carboxypeptidase